MQPLHSRAISRLAHEKKSRRIILCLRRSRWKMARPRSTINLRPLVLPMSSLGTLVKVSRGLLPRRDLASEPGLAVRFSKRTYSLCSAYGSRYCQCETKGFVIFLCLQVVMFAMFPWMKPWPLCLQCPRSRRS